MTVIYLIVNHFYKYHMLIHYIRMSLQYSTNNDILHDL
jgi:hypothetical protein